MDEAGEVIYRDAVGVLCRCWNWREAERAKLTAATTDAFLCIELAELTSPAQEQGLAAACEELAERIRRLLGGATRIATLSPALSDLDHGFGAVWPAGWRRGDGRG